MAPKHRKSPIIGLLKLLSGLISLGVLLVSFKTYNSYSDLSELSANDVSNETIGSTKIHGRFLHITDLHPDLYYKEGSSVESACHSGKGEASKYGDAMAGCDAPYSLVKQTIEWINENLKDQIDFIIWSGDNVRHDNDRSIPRTESQIFDVNENISALMIENFKDHSTPDSRAFHVPLIPSLGNNDVYPHNLFALGPTLQTRLLHRTWSSYIPQAQAHVFEKNACFMREVIPGKLAVLSINTLYLFKSNPLVDNCDSKKQPGYTLFVWLGYTLKELRKRGMKVWLSGHVPPVPKNYELTCYRKYILWIHEYRDIIVGNLFGHMNMDHFIPLDAVAAYKSLKEDRSMPGYSELLSTFSYLDSDEESFAVLDHLKKSNERSHAVLSSELREMGAAPGLNKLDYITSVREIFYDSLESVSSNSKNKGSKNNGSRYSILHVAGSVIPTFNPAFRVWEYNVSQFQEQVNVHETSKNSWDEFFNSLNVKLENIEDIDEGQLLADMMNRADKSLPSFSGENIQLGPAFESQTFSPTNFTQYYLDLKSVNNGKKPFAYEVEYTSRDEPYAMDTLLVNDWIELGKKLSKKSKKGKKLWKKYLQRVFISTGYEDWVEDQK